MGLYLTLAKSPSVPSNTIFDVKRLMGKNFSDKSVQEDLKQQTSYKLNQKKDKHKIVGSVARSVDVKDAIDDVINEKIDIK